MSEFPHLPFYTQRFIADTQHLDAAETGAYAMLLFIAWQLPECRLPDDDVKLARWARASARVWRRIKPVVMSFWAKDEDGFWVQKRLSEVRKFVHRMVEIKRHNGKLGGRPKSLKNHDVTEANGSVSLKLNESEPKASKSKYKKERGPGAEAPFLSGEFEAFWDGYPKTKTANPKAVAAKVFAHLSAEDQALALATLPAYRVWVSEQFRGYQPPGAAVYLRQRRFDDFRVTPPASADPEKVLAGQRTMARLYFSGEWHPNWGAAPGEAGCTIPADVIAEAAQATGKAWPPNPADKLGEYNSRLVAVAATPVAAALTARAGGASA